MKVLLSLTVLCLTVALGHGACFSAPLEAQLKHGKVVMPNVCTDPYDKSKHPFGSKWNTADCMSCKCNKNGLTCCTRYGGVVYMPGCTAVVDPETCKYKFYKQDDPTKACF